MPCATFQETEPRFRRRIRLILVLPPAADHAQREGLSVLAIQHAAERHLESADRVVHVVDGVEEVEEGHIKFALDTLPGLRVNEGEEPTRRKRWKIHIRVG